MRDLESILDSVCDAVADVRIKLALSASFMFALTFVGLYAGVR